MKVKETYPFFRLIVPTINESILIFFVEKKSPCKCISFSFFCNFFDLASLEEKAPSNPEHILLFVVVLIVFQIILNVVASI